MKPGKTYEVLDKSTGQLIGTAPDFSVEEAEAAIAKANDGFRTWALSPAHARSKALGKAAEAIKARRDELAQLLARETGKVLRDALVEVDTTERVFRGFSEEVTRHFGQAIELDRQEGLEGDLLITKHEPLGVVVAITPFNFPAELYAHKVGAALGAGNTVLVKPAEPNPLISIALTQILHESGVPDSALQVVSGRGALAGIALTESENIQAISFTGSTLVGTQIATAAAKNLVRVTLELGGNDAFIVAADADLALAVGEAVAGRTFSNGQVCVATKRIIVVQEVLDAFMDALVEKVREIRVGNALDPQNDMGPLISESAAEKVERQIASALAQGGELVLKGDRRGQEMDPTIIRISPDSDVARDEEIFGPVFSIIPVASLGEGVEVANASSYGLNAAVFTSDFSAGFAAAERLEAGIVSINGGNLYRPDGSAFGGYKKSGIGREGFFYSLDEFTQLKTVAFRGIRNSIL